MYMDFIISQTRVFCVTRCDYICVLVYDRWEHLFLYRLWGGGVGGGVDRMYYKTCVEEEDR
jgi:hypothetical protein